MRTITALIIAFTALAPAGCGDTGPDRIEVAVDTVDGVERLTYAAEPATALDWSVDTVAVLGDAFAEDAYQFNNVAAGGLASDDAGNLYVLDRQGGRILKYAPDGSHLATVGRQGGGPGELSQPIALSVGPGDTIWVSDFSNSRFTGYPQDGDDPRTIAFPENAGIPGQRLATYGDGFITMFRPLLGISRSGGRMQMTRIGQEAADSGPPMLPVLRLTRSLEPVDTLWSTPEPPMDMVQLEAAGNIMVTMMSREFYPDFQWAGFSDGGIVVSDSAAYVLRLLDPGGNLVRTIARGPAPRATTEADREGARQRVRDESQGAGVRIGGGGGPDEETRDRILQQRLEKMTFAELIPRIVDLRVDPADRIWVAVSEDTPDEADRIDIYDRDGSLLGELRDFPFPDVFMTADRIGVLRADELDVQQVVILDVNRTEQELASR